MGLFDNPYRLHVMTSYFTYRQRMDVPLANAARADGHEKIQIQGVYFESKPSGMLHQFEAEERVWDENGGPFIGTFDPDNVPAGISMVEHLTGVSIVASRLILEIYRVTGQQPTCGLAEVGIANLLDFCAVSTKPPTTSPQSFWRNSVGTFFRSVDIHREPDCAGPYLIPRGELWLMMAWRYDRPMERCTEWAKPVGIIRFKGHLDPAMVTIARCAR